ncbi:ADP-ribosylglycohydrolase family protein [Geobacter sp.]|uniref:ADP-ribosylglycohydrolase family protein n=1 Tax=Geobacter sp. TaxID=46610 RepID=UPI002619C047|nr:ADP-ribosylglycohydrolase family protein [Geobacter sp.]
MLGAIAGDIIGSVYEYQPIKSEEFPLFGPDSHFTDDTVMTVAVAHAILEGIDYAAAMKAFGRRHPDAGYGGSFIRWIFEDAVLPYNSWGNGAAMRVSPIGLAFDSVERVLREAKLSAEISHNHPEGIRGAQATALAVFLARTGAGKEAIRHEITRRFGYDLNRTITDVRPRYGFDVSCQGSVPEALIAFLDSRDYEDTVRKAVSLGGDSDTLACIAGGIAEAFYREIPPGIADTARLLLPEEFLAIIDRFTRIYPG